MVLKHRELFWLLFDGDRFVEDVAAAEDGDVVCEGKRDAVAWARIDFQNVAFFSDLLFKVDACKVDRIFDIVDDDLKNSDVEALHETVEKIMRKGAWSMSFCEIAL